MSTGHGPLQKRATVPEPRHSSWKHCLKVALRESHNGPLLTRVHAAEAALFLRWQELQADQTERQERADMLAACDQLLALKVHKLNWPALHG